MDMGPHSDLAGDLLKELPHPVLKIENAPSSLVAAMNVQPGKNSMWLISFTMFLNAGDNQRK